MSAKRTWGPPAATSYRIEVHKRLADVEAVWRDLETQVPASVYQRFDFLDAWQRTLGAAAGVEPHVVVIETDDGRAALLPFGIGRAAGVPTLGFLGGKHVNINIGLIRREFRAELTPAAVEHILAAAVAADPAIGAIALHNMPLHWDGAANPLALADGLPAPDQIWLIPLRTDFASLVRAHKHGSAIKTLARKLQRLGEAGDLQFLTVQTMADAGRVIDDYLHMKRSQLQQRGVRSDILTEAYRDFLIALAERSLRQRTAVLDLRALAVGDEVLSVALGGTHQGCYSLYGTAMAEHPLMRYSPGDQMLNRVIEDSCRLGLQTFDLGISRTQQKARWQDHGEPLVDLFRAVSARGQMAVATLKLGQRAKRSLKQNPALMAFYNSLRQRLGGHARPSAHD